MKTDHLPHLTPPTLSPTRRIQQRGASLFGVLLVVAALLGGLWYAGYLEFEPHPTQSVSSHQSLSDETFADMTRVVNGVAMLPMREAFEALDAQVHYDAKRDVAVAEVPGSTVTLRPGAQRAMVGGKPFLMSVPSKVIDGTLYVPRRFVQETAEANLDVASVEL